MRPVPGPGRPGAGPAAAPGVRGPLRVWVRAAGLAVLALVAVARAGGPTHARDLGWPRAAPGAAGPLDGRAAGAPASRGPAPPGAAEGGGNGAGRGGGGPPGGGRGRRRGRRRKASGRRAILKAEAWKGQLGHRGREREKEREKKEREDGGSDGGASSPRNAHRKRAPQPARVARGEGQPKPEQRAGTEAGRPSAAGEGDCTNPRFREQVATCLKGQGFLPAPEGECKLRVKYPPGTNSKWVYHKTGKTETLDYDYDLCRMTTYFQHLRQMTTVVTKEYLDAHPDPLPFIQKKANNRVKGDGIKKRLRQVRGLAPERPPYVPGQFDSCAVVGNSRDLLKHEYGAEIDGHDAVIRVNEAVTTERYWKHVGKRTTFRVLNNMAWLGRIDKRTESPQEVVLIKGEYHSSIMQQAKELKNPLYFLHAPRLLPHSAGGTGVVSIQFALSVCKEVFIYGFSTEPRYKSWGRYFTPPTAGHHPLRGRVFYETLDCMEVLHARGETHPRVDRPAPILPARSCLTIECKHKAGGDRAADGPAATRWYPWLSNSEVEEQMCVA